MLRRIRVNSDYRIVTDEQLKKALYYRLKNKKYIRVHWGGTSEAPTLLEDGRIEGEGRIGGRELAKKGYYKDFDTWYEESILYNEKRIDLSLENAERLGDKVL